MRLLKKYRVTGEELVLFSDLLPYTFMAELENVLNWMESKGLERSQEINHMWLLELVSYEAERTPFVFKLNVPGRYIMEVCGPADLLLKMYFIAPGGKIEKI